MDARKWNWISTCQTDGNWLLRCNMEKEGAVRKPLSEGCDWARVKQTAYEPTVEKDRRGR